MEPEKKDASSEPPNDVHPGITPTSANTPPSSEVVDIEDLRKRFTAIESKITAVSDIFGLKGLTEEAEEEDSDSSSEESDDSLVPFSEIEFFSDAAFFLHSARVSHKRIQRDRAARRHESKLVRNRARDRADKAKQESVRQASTTAFLNSEPAIVTWMHWGRFYHGKTESENSILSPIDAVIGEPEQLMLQLTSSALQSSDPVAEDNSYGTRTSTDLEQTLLPERIRINSSALSLNLVASNILNFLPDEAITFLRPFKAFIYREKNIRYNLDELEKRFNNWDGTEKIPKKGGGPKTTSFSTDSIQEAIVKEGESERTSLGPEENNTVGETDEYGDEMPQNSITALLHLRCLMKFIDDEIKPKLRHLESNQYRRILFQDLWHFFKPGDEVVDQTEKQAYRVVRVQTPQHRVTHPWQRWHRKAPNDKDEQNDETPMRIQCAYIDFDGKQLGPVSVKFSIPPFGGLRDIKLLPIYPLRFAKDCNLRNNLITRGKMLLNIAKFKPMYYMGLTLDTRDEIDSQVVVDFSEALVDEKHKEWRPTIESLSFGPDDIQSTRCSAPCCENQRIYREDYVDLKLTEDFVKSLVADFSFRNSSLILSPRPLEEALPGTDDAPTDDEFVIMTYRVFGFVLRSRKWAQLDLTFLKYENTDLRNSALSAFDRLELPYGHREMVKSLVTQHFRDRQTGFTKDDQTDLVKGKGKGLIMLLHGAPGVGKTTTAEGIAELFQKPLFQITCGDLGTTAREVEKELEKNFALASRWGCVLLLDEADVFLSARERKDFERNGLVAVFLRVMEYYTGILFLTTNRVGDFDEAFASRIHMSLYYPELDEPKTTKIFKLNLSLIQERFDKQGRKITYDVSSIEDFAKKHFNEHPYSRWNGRQIRNACQTALALAEFDAHDGKIQAEVDSKIEVKLQLKHFQSVQTAYLDFGRYLGDIRGTQGDRRAIDYGFRAKSSTPYQTTPSRFSTAPSNGSQDNHHLSSVSVEYGNEYNNEYSRRSQGGSQSDPFNPFPSQTRAGGPGDQTYGLHGPGQMRPGGSYNRYDRYESPQGYGYTHLENRQGQIDPRQYQQSNLQRGNPVPRQYYQGQSPYNPSNVQHGGEGGSMQAHVMSGTDSITAPGPGNAGPEGYGPP